MLLPDSEQAVNRFLLQSKHLLTLLEGREDGFRIRPELRLVELVTIMPPKRRQGIAASDELGHR